MRPFEAVAADPDYPMVIVTTRAGAERDGCLVGFGTQCSMDPPRLRELALVDAAWAIAAWDPTGAYAETQTEERESAAAS